MLNLLIKVPKHIAKSMFEIYAISADSFMAIFVLIYNQESVYQLNLKNGQWCKLFTVQHKIYYTTKSGSLIISKNKSR